MKVLGGQRSVPPHWEERVWPGVGSPSCGPGHAGSAKGGVTEAQGPSGSLKGAYQGAQLSPKGQRNHVSGQQLEVAASGPQHPHSWGLGLWCQVYLR